MSHVGHSFTSLLAKVMRKPPTSPPGQQNRFDDTFVAPSGSTNAVILKSIKRDGSLLINKQESRKGLAHRTATVERYNGDLERRLKKKKTYSISMFFEVAGEQIFFAE